MTTKGIRQLEDTALYSFLGADGIADLKTKIIDMLVEEIHDQLKDSHEYLISPDDIAEYLQEDIIEEVKEEVIDEYRKKVSAIMDKKLEGLGGLI